MGIRPTSVGRRQAEEKRAQTDLLSKVKRRTRRAPEPGSLGGVYTSVSLDSIEKV